MKKIKSFFLFTAFFITALFALPPGAVIQGNATDDEKYLSIINTNFDSGDFENWVAFGNRSKISLTTKKSHSGGFSLFIYERDESWSGPSLNINELVVQGEEYLLRAYVVGETNGSGDPLRVKATLRYVDSSGSVCYDSIGEVEVGNTNWEKFNDHFTVPENANNVSIYFETSESTAEFYLDDFELFSFSGVVKQETTKDPSASTNLSYGFENDLDGWMPRGTVNLKISDSFSYDGRNSLFVSDKVEFWSSPMVALNEIKPEVNYNYSACIMYLDKNFDDNHSFAILLQYNLNGEEAYEQIANKTLQKGTWSKITGDFALPEGASDVYFYIQSDEMEPNETGGYIPYYVDNVKITDTTQALQAKRLNIILICTASVVGAVALALLTMVTVKRARTTKAAIKLACIDVMTNTYNRNIFEDHIAELEESPERCKKVYITACDVNFLKYINDNYGHDCGDSAIIRCANVLLRAIGRHGKVYRIGGDEFMCISDGNFTDAIKVEFARENMDYKGYPFSVAVGTSHYDPMIDTDGPDVKAIIARSDKAMYEHKTEIKRNADFID